MPKELGRKTPDYWRYKSFRDPLYGFIGVTRNELKIIQSEPFQRLRRLKQLSYAYLVYPSAMHVRFEHALGTLSVADRMCSSLALLDNARELVRLAAITHDLGHGPFSHLFEEALKLINGETFSHEVVTAWIVKDDGEISDALGSLKENVLSLLPTYRGAIHFPLLREIISSGLDADKLDYLRRDSYHIGVAYGSFDLERIIHTLSKTPDKNSLCVLEKGKDATENYRLGRYLMHAQVYEHHTRLCTDGMFLRSLELAIAEGTVDRDALRVGSRKNAFMSSDHSNFLRYYMNLDDNTIVRMISEAGGNAKKLVDGLYSRKLLKASVRLNPALDVVDALRKKKISEMTRGDQRRMEEEIASETHCDPDFVISYLQKMTIKLYDPYDILVKRDDGTVLTIDEVSPFAASTQPIVNLYVFCPRNYKQRVNEATYRYFGLEPEER